MRDAIEALHAHEILDSRGNPTLSVTVLLKSGVRGRAAVPSGASTGAHEAHELRDGDPRRYRGLGVRQAARNVNEKILRLLLGHDVFDQRGIDDAMRILDGTENKHRLGANAILGVSLACAHAAARRARLPLYRYLRSVFRLGHAGYRLPTPLLNVINGGRHADTNLDVQEFQLIPHGFKNFATKLQAGSEIFHALGDLLQADGFDTDVGNEGGYGPNMKNTEEALLYLVKAIRKAKYTVGKEVSLGVDVAASEFFDEKKGKYIMKADRRRLAASGMIDLYSEWTKKYPLMAIEDGLAEDAWGDWREMTKQFGKKTMLVGDDFFVTNVERIQQGIEEGAANAVLIKPNQIGTLSETIDAIVLAQKNKYKIVVSHRSGETPDTTIADLAVAVNAEYLKAGAPSRSERLAKYNRLLEIEEEVRG